MSRGKRWKMSKKQIHRQPHSRRWIYKVCGGRKGHPGYKYFRRRQKFRKLMYGKVGMSKFTAMEIWYWD